MSLDSIGITKLMNKNIIVAKLPLYNNSNLEIQFYEKFDYIKKLKPKQPLFSFPLIIFSICTLIMMFSLSVSYTNIDLAVVSAQESNQIRLNENVTTENNFNGTQLSTILDNDKDGGIKSNNIETDKKDVSRVLTLVTEDAEIDIAPGERVKVWTFNGTVPGPTIRLAEGENVTIKYINKSPIPHTIHFHGNHDDVNDGVVPQVMPGQTYLYNITGEPAGALMYHCHAPPTSMHIRMGMYGALIVDPVDKQIAPAKEFVMVMGEYSLKNQMGFEADYYMMNGYADQYVDNPLQINQDDLMRIYLINMGTTIPASFHLHSTTFLTYPSGLWANTPLLSQTVSVAPGDASIVEAKWKYPGDYFFHTHGIQEEKGNMGQIKVIGQGELSEEIDARIGNNTSTTIHDFYQTHNVSEPLNKSISMFDWQYELQKKLQNPQVVSQPEHTSINNQTNIQHKQDTISNANSISIVPNSSSPENKIFYDPSTTSIEKGTEVTWINDDKNMPHTVTSGNPDQGPSGIFDSGIINGDGSSYKFTFDNEGEYRYYCTLHPWMMAKIIVK